MDDGLILVWDVDQTLSGQYFDPNVFLKNPTVNPYDYVILNPKALQVIQLANDAKTTGRVAIQGILTNNGDENFIQLIISAIENKIGQKHIFDFVMTRNHPSRESTDQQPKRLQDIQTMLNEIGAPTTNLANRVYFFDDMVHVLKSELPADHYIQILPPFPGKDLYENPDLNGESDETNWQSILTALRQLPPPLKGGRRMRRPAKKSRRRHKKRSRQSRSTRDGSS
jgi:hypothetical protein